MPDWTAGEDARQAEYRDEGGPRPVCPSCLGHGRQYIFNQDGSPNEAVCRWCDGTGHEEAGPSLPRPAVDGDFQPHPMLEIRRHSMGREAEGWWWTCACGEEAGPFGVWEQAHEDAIRHANGRPPMPERSQAVYPRGGIENGETR